jgi:hypothetical protein
MEIMYAGSDSFLIKGEQTVAINPVEKTSEANIVLRTDRKRSTKLIVNGPGEYEIGGVLIASIASGDRMLHAVEVDGINIVHLVGYEKRLSEQDLETIGKVDVLLVGASDARLAQTAVSDLIPRVIIPFGPHAAEICAASGVKDAAAQSKFTWNGATTPPKAVLLKAPPPKKRAA